MRRRTWRRLEAWVVRCLRLTPPPRPARLPGLAAEDGWKPLVRERPRVHLN